MLLNINVAPHGALADQARRWIGVHEIGGSNKGEIVELFQKSVDGRATGEPWCMGFVQYCVATICLFYRLVTQFFKTEHCLTAWVKTPSSLKTVLPKRGYIAIFQHGNSSEGHTEIVDDPGTLSYEHNVYSGTFTTVGGNTNKAGSREGDGVYSKTRSGVMGDMHLLGFIAPFGIEYD